ncbi:MAG: class I SAM-dependent methyltransferase [Chloroherpetonaceae bacterium]|nr:class I SAM-dependent methyltransferase [Chthonomonadaceae bacterium]MDW8208320.1 class I SAM-dependent methyltransferase [Chloroherpetonaceae bacterium]
MAVKQDIGSVESFGWQWTQRKVYDTRRELYRKLCTSRGVWYDYYDGKVVADVGSGNGRFTYALALLTKAKEILSVELSPEALENQKRHINDPRVTFIQGDAATVKFKADVIYAAGFIQHTADPLATLKNLIDNLNDDGEILISFYKVTLMTRLLEPLRSVLKRLPKKTLWSLTPLLGWIFYLRKSSRALGYINARHTAYDWFGSHEYQYYFTDAQIRDYFQQCGIHPNNVLHVSGGLYRARKGDFPLQLDDELITFWPD